MSNRQLTRAIVRRRIEDGDHVHIAVGKPYTPQTEDHKHCWSRMAAVIERSGDRGVQYATLRAMGGSNKDYAAYLIGQQKVLRCPALEQRLDFGG